MKAQVEVLNNPGRATDEYVLLIAVQESHPQIFVGRIYDTSDSLYEMLSVLPHYRAYMLNGEN